MPVFEKVKIIHLTGLLEANSIEVVIVYGADGSGPQEQYRRQSILHWCVASCLHKAEVCPDGCRQRPVMSTGISGLLGYSYAF